jgi:hypothetical protein
VQPPLQDCGMCSLVQLMGHIARSFCLPGGARPEDVDAMASMGNVTMMMAALMLV